MVVKNESQDMDSRNRPLREYFVQARSARGRQSPPSQAFAAKEHHPSTKTSIVVFKTVVSTLQDCRALLGLIGSQFVALDAGPEIRPEHKDEYGRDSFHRSNHR